MRGGHVLSTVVGGVLAGVLVRSFIPLGLSTAGFLVLLALAVVLVARNARGILMGCALAAFALGIVRMQAAVYTGDPGLTARADEQVTILGRVFEAPDVRTDSTRVYVQADTLITKYEKVRVRAGVIVVAPAHAAARYGDEVLAYGTLRLPEAFDTTLGRQFAYPQYLAAHGVGYELTGAELEVQDAPWRGNYLKAAALSVRAAFLRGVRAVLPEPEAGLASGITVGDKRALGDDLAADFRTASLSHIVVFSGYHVGVVGNAMRYLLQWAPRYAQYGVVSFAVLFFVLMSGASASAVRAGAMALIAVYARASSRTFFASRALGVVALCMVLYDPFLLAFDPSFQLSSLATLGLIIFTPRIKPWIARVPERFGAREILATTLGAQLAVLPLLLYQNGSLPLFSIPANLLALAPMPFVMFFAFVAGAAGMLMGTWGVVAAAPGYALLWYVISVAQFFAGLPYAALLVPAFSGWWLLAGYAVLFGGAAYFDADDPHATLSLWRS